MNVQSDMIKETIKKWDSGYPTLRQIHSQNALIQTARTATMYLRDVNLNLLPILLSLLRTRSVSEAAKNLRLSQPAVSAALARLRAQFRDDLLVRIGGHMKLTPTAAALLDPLETLCVSMEGFFQPKLFDPAKTTRQVVVATSDICGFLLARPILRLLENCAPDISLHLVEIEHNLTERMAARDIDFVLLPDFAISDLAPAPLRFTPLLPVSTVLLMRAGHPLCSQAAVTEADCARYPHIVFQPDAMIGNTGRILTLAGGVEFKVVARVGHLLLIPHLLVDSDSVSIVPSPLAEFVSTVQALEYRSIVDGGTHCSVGLAWSPVQDADPAHAWFRSSLSASFVDAHRH